MKQKFIDGIDMDNISYTPAITTDGTYDHQKNCKCSRSTKPEWLKVKPDDWLWLLKTREWTCSLIPYYLSSCKGNPLLLTFALVVLSSLSERVSRTSKLRH
ncbi:hypothetical protein K6636_22610 [Escherichia coli]|uniref:hypothetical protein n=1 Tax=Escherichia coli TaxID=562 RepID=UPI0012FFC2EC|nr:hypothetical protein [Escherichia coli]MBY7301269.1 hypothetical protein [Escherichia coli]HAX2106273.1 hypothetical protein [Escherichia coli]HDL8903534.1 hypothetical protein [Escherichia coli]